MFYLPNPDRYGKFKYAKCGNSGLYLPPVSLGIWHNFGNITPFETQRDILRTAFDNGITHFDAANNYGPPYGEAERNFGIHMDRDWRTHRDELIISTKAGFDMWPGPYGNGGSRKYLLSSLDQSLKRMRVDYVDIFYHHRFDPDTPLEETMSALDYAVRSGKALYVGISNYGAKETKEAIKILRDLGTPLLIRQPHYNMFDRWIEKELLSVLENNGVGCMAFAPLAGGVLTGKYLNCIPSDSRAGHDPRYLKPEHISNSQLSKVQKLAAIAKSRGQSLAQLAIAWSLRLPAVTSVLIGASRPQQVTENLAALSNLSFTKDELSAIDTILSEK